MTQAYRSSPPLTWKTKAQCSCRCSRYDVQARWAPGPCYKGADPEQARLWPESSKASGIGFSPHESSASGCAKKFARLRRVVHHQFAPRKDLRRIASHLPSFEHVVVGRHALRCRRDGVLDIGIPEENVCVEACLDGSLLLLHPEDAGRRSAAHLNKFFRRDAACIDAVMPDDLQAVFNAGAAIRNLGKVVAPQRFLVGKAEWTMVGRDDREWPVCECIP